MTHYERRALQRARRRVLRNAKRHGMSVKAREWLHSTDALEAGDPRPRLLLRLRLRMTGVDAG